MAFVVLLHKSTEHTFIIDRHFRQTVSIKENKSTVRANN